jgi:hypothetical protein
MIVPSDKDYVETKLIKRGEAVVNPDFEPLKEWIENHYSVTVLNIYYDVTTGPHNKPFPRIQVIFERQADSLKFRDGLGNYDPEKQRTIAAKFEQLVNKRGKLEALVDSVSDVFGGKVSAKYPTNGVLVVFTAFEPVAKDEANEAIPKAEIERLKTGLHTSEIWEISRFGARTTVFFYTDQQALKAKGSELLQHLTSRYYQLLKNYDEFDYYDEDSFTLDIDSKENFDKNFESSWFYYYR